MHVSLDRTVHTTAFDKPVVDHWLERKIAQTAAGSTEGGGMNECIMTPQHRNKSAIECQTKMWWNRLDSTPH